MHLEQTLPTLTRGQLPQLPLLTSNLKRTPGRGEELLPQGAAASRPQAPGLRPSSSSSSRACPAQPRRAPHLPPSRLCPLCPGPWSEVTEAVRTPKPGLTPDLSAHPALPKCSGVSTAFWAASPVTPSTRASLPRDGLTPGTSTRAPVGTSHSEWHRHPGPLPLRVGSIPAQGPQASLLPDTLTFCTDKSLWGTPTPAPPVGLHASRGSRPSAGTDLARGGVGCSSHPRASLGPCVPRLHTGYHTSWAGSHLVPPVP